MQIAGVETARPRKLDIELKLAFREAAAVRLLDWLAQENALILREQPDLPNLYETSVRYEREKTEAWLDVIRMYDQGFEDCDGLSAARAGELMARGHEVLEPGDGGYRYARRNRLEYIEARPFLRTRTEPGRSGLYHCIVRYRVGDHWFRDDPAARLGMFDGEQRDNPWGDRPEPARVSRRIAGQLTSTPTSPSRSRSR